jgi:hypothetical protein
VGAADYGASHSADFSFSRYPPASPASPANSSGKPSPVKTESEVEELPHSRTNPFGPVGNSPLLKDHSRSRALLPTSIAMTNRNRVLPLGTRVR